MRNATAIAVLALFLSACQTMPGGGGDTVLDAAEVRRLFVGNTVESYNLSTGFNSFTYYHPNGQAVQERLWAKRVGSWQIREDGSICLAFNNAEPKCRPIVYDGRRYYKVGSDDQGGQERLVRYRYFKPGNALAGS